MFFIPFLKVFVAGVNPALQSSRRAQAVSACQRAFAQGALAASPFAY